MIQVRQPGIVINPSVESLFPKAAPNGPDDGLSQIPGDVQAR